MLNFVDTIITQQNRQKTFEHFGANLKEREYIKLFKHEINHILTKIAIKNSQINRFSVK